MLYGLQIKCWFATYDTFWHIKAILVFNNWQWLCDYYNLNLQQSENIGTYLSLKLCYYIQLLEIKLQIIDYTYQSQRY